VTVAFRGGWGAARHVALCGPANGHLRRRGLVHRAPGGNLTRRGTIRSHKKPFPRFGLGLARSQGIAVLRRREEADQGTQRRMGAPEGHKVNDQEGRWADFDAGRGRAALLANPQRQIDQRGGGGGLRSRPQPRWRWWAANRFMRSFCFFLCLSWGGTRPAVPAYPGRWRT